MSTVPMPDPPEGHYWRIGRTIGTYRRVNLVKPRAWWTGKVIQWGVMVPVSDEHENAREAVRVAHYVLDKFYEGYGDPLAGLNGLTGYVDHRGRTR